jgi:MFS family permease
VVHAGPRFFGLVLSLYYGASLLGGLLIAKFDVDRVPFPALLLTAVFAWGGLGVLRTEIPLLCLSFLTGLVNCFIYTRYETTLQQHTPANLMGQTASLARAAYSAAQVAGILACGQMAERLGPVAAYRWTFGGAMILTLVAAFAVQSIGRPKPAAEAVR